MPMKNNKKPIIGLTMTQVVKENQIELWKEYVDSIAKAGGIPILLPSLADFSFYDEYLDEVDGLFITGGDDIMPCEYGEEPLAGFKLEWPMTPERDRFEIEITKKALERNMPVLGVCRGLQIINVVFGGTIFQDIDMQTNRSLKLKHFQECPYWYCQHEIIVDSNSKFYEIMDGEKNIRVNSMHHQAIGKLGTNISVSATAHDGIIEAIECNEYDYAIGVQWHPERLYEREKKWYKLFHSFVVASQAYQSNIKKDKVV